MQDTPFSPQDMKGDMPLSWQTAYRLLLWKKTFANTCFTKEEKTVDTLLFCGLSLFFR